MAEPFATSVASNLVSKLGEYLFAPIGRQFGYVLCYKSYVEDLKKGVKDLNNARERVQYSVDEAFNDGKLIFNDVKDWLQSVKEEVEEAENLLKDEESAKNACFPRWLPNPMMRHPLGRKVKKMTQVIQGLHDESANNNFQKVYYENPPIGIVTAAGAVNDKGAVDDKDVVLESKATIIEDVMKAIANDKHRVIGVYGPGGVGKSKLLEDVEKRVKKEKLVDVIALANVSRNPDLKTIQGEIADALGLKLVNVESARGRANRLRERLECYHEKSILIILDNLWKKLELKDVGIPCGDNNKVRGCKLLLSSRDRDVLRSDMGIDREFKLNELNHGEARRLFENIVEDRANDPDFKPLVDGVVQKCGGLPLLIISVAKRLKYGALAEWRNALTNMDLSDAKSIVELNYNDLEDDRIRSVFLVSALKPEKIFMRWNLSYCMGLGLYKKFKTIEDARDRLIMDLHRLQNSSLLLDGDDMEELRMHDIFADVAISITSTEWKALVGKKGYNIKEWSKDELIKCTAMSFPCVGIDELPEKLDCPNLKMLLLLEDNPSLKIPKSFFESVEKLQVLDITGLSFNSLPLSIECLENLQSLCLDYCHLEDVTALEKLKGLQFLSFQGSVITKLSKELGELVELRFLNLTGCAQLKIIEPGVLGSLVNLEELYMEDSFVRWEAEDEAPQSNASLAELKNMKKLRTLYIAIPYSAYLPRDLPFGKLSKHKIQIGDVWDWSGEYIESRTLKLKVDLDNLLLEESVAKCLQKTQDLHLDGLQDGIDSIHKLCVEGFQELKHIHVQNSSSFKYVVCSIENVHCTTFTRLESLFLKNLCNLEKISHGCLAIESFSKLKIVKVDNCGEIKHLFPLSMKRIISQLKEIEISKCPLIQEVLGDAEADEDRDEIVDDIKVITCNLCRLTLQNLPKMTNFCKIADHSIDFFNGQQVSLPWLESLTLSKLSKLKEIWNSEFPSDVSNLRFLNVEDCTFLLSIFPSNLVTKLQNLEAITIKRCRLIQEVFDLEGLTASGDVEILSQLTTLTLSDLPRLGHIWNKNPRRASCFRNLRLLKVQNCDNLRFLFSSYVAKALGHIKEIEIASCKLMEEIIDVEGEESVEAASIDSFEFPLLTSLSLKELPSLKTFSYGSIHCPTLTRLWISGCQKMMSFSSIKGKLQSMTANAGLQQASGHVNSSLSLSTFFDQNVHFPSLEELTLLSLCWVRSIWHNELSEGSFCKLASITVRDCEDLSHIFPSTLVERFQSLKMIEVVECTSLEALVDRVAINAMKRAKRLVFSNLKEVKLWDLPRLHALVTSSTKATLGLPSLTNVSLGRCHSLRYLFTNDTSRTLDKLEMLDVSGCSNMQEVVVTEESEKQKLTAVKFSHLQILKLCSLKSLVSFSLGSCAYKFPSLRMLSILECTELKAFILRLPAPRMETMNEAFNGFDQSPLSLFDEKVVFPKLEELCLTGIQSRGLWENATPDESFCQLKVIKVKRCPNLLNVIPSFMLHYMESLIVEECPRLRSLFTVSMAKSLVQLQYLVLRDCGEMKYIVAREEEELEDAADIIVIPQLVTLHLRKMIKLRSFCHGKHISKWPSLKKFTVEDCKAVKVILGEVSCTRLEGSGPTQQPLLLVEKVDFPNMESMKVSHMDNVEKLWPSELASNAFTKLETLVVEYCEKLSSLFSSHAILTRFQNLKEIAMIDCGSLEVVFHNQEFNFGEACSTSTFELRKLVLSCLPKMKHVWSGHPCGTLTYERLQCLKAQSCESLKSLFPISIAKSMTQLKELLIYDCGVEEIIMDEDGEEMRAGDLFFPRLTDLRLLELPEWRSFYRNIHTSTWPLLKKLRVRHCGKMRPFTFACELQGCQGTTISENQPALFSFEEVIPRLEGSTLTRGDVEVAMTQQYSIFGNLRELALSCYHDENVAFPSNFLLQSFPSLEELLVICSSFEEIFPEGASGLGGPTSYGGLTGMENPVKALANLERLYLIKLCNLRRVWKDGFLMAEILNRIKYLFIVECPSLSIVFPSRTSFQRLKQLSVEDCAGLVHMGTCSAVSSLVHLTWLTLRSCAAMEDVVTDDGNGADEISFPELILLILDNLSSLESFSPTNCAFRFPALECIVVTQCPKMKKFCEGTLRTPNLDKVLLSDGDDEWRWEGDLDTTIRTLST